ncbi:MAG: asparagine synthase (glutamine-hydrolyzing) [Chloroflexota bacterium]
MCGIGGSVAFHRQPPDIVDLLSMVSALGHRGPDAAGIYRDELVGLSHTRLAIIDLVTGAQPMTDERERYWLVFNGEIFNYIELRGELSELGHRFRTTSDTEVIIQAFAAWGLDAFPRFNGQFALAIWDRETRRLVLARDRFGICPLYHATHDGRFYFASEVKGIFAARPDLPRAWDPAGILETFTFWAALPPRTVFEGVSQLRPGHVRIITENGVDERTFVRPAVVSAGRRSSSLTTDEAATEVRAVLEDAVRLRLLRSDVPVGCYLSGGLDSSVLAALARRVHGEHLRTFSIRFEDAEFDESRFQHAVARSIGSDHQELVVTRADIARAFPEVVAHTEAPVLRTAPAPMFMLSGLVRDAGIKVVLTGEGADEMFAGYDLFREGRVRRFWGRRPESTIRPRLLGRLYPYLDRSPVRGHNMAADYFGRDREHHREPGFAHRVRWSSTSALRALFGSSMTERIGAADVVEGLIGGLPAEFSDWSYLAQDQHLEITTLLSSYLLSSQGDRMLMAHSVEGRFPYLDDDVVALAGSLPDSLKLFGLDEKHVLKRAARGLVPEEILHRPKQPYRAPDAQAFIGPDRPSWVDEIIDPESVRAAGVFDPGSVARLWRKVQSGGNGRSPTNMDNMALVGVLSVGLVHQRLIREGSGSGLIAPSETAIIDHVPGAGSRARSGEVAGVSRGRE